MEYWITWGGDPEDVYFSTRGVGSMLDVRAMVSEALADPRWQEGLSVLFDHTLTEWSALPDAELKELALLHIELGPKFGRQRVAFAVRDQESFLVERLVALSLDREVPWVGHVFDSLTAAREWLRKPSEQIVPHILPRW